MAHGAGDPWTLEAETSAEPALRVVIADDDVLLRSGVASLLSGSGFEVVGEAGDAAELLALVPVSRRRHPSLPGGDDAPPVSVVASPQFAGFGVAPVSHPRRT